MFLTAGSFTVAFRAELATPQLDVVSDDAYNAFMSLHVIVMISSILLDVADMSNLLAP